MAIAKETAKQILLWAFVLGCGLLCLLGSGPDGAHAAGYGSSGSMGGFASVSPTTGNTSGDLVCMNGTTTGIKDCGYGISVISPTFTDASGGGNTLTPIGTPTCIQIQKVVTCWATLTYPASVSGTTSAASITATAIPTSTSQNIAVGSMIGSVTVTGGVAALIGSSSKIILFTSPGNDGTAITNLQLQNSSIAVQITYRTN